MIVRGDIEISRFSFLNLTLLMLLSIIILILLIQTMLQYILRLLKNFGLY